MTKLFVSNNATIYPDDCPQINSIKIKALVHGWDEVTWVNMWLCDKGAANAISRALNTISDLQHQAHDYTGRVSDIDSWANVNVDRIRFSLHTLNQLDIKRIFRLIEDYSKVQLPHVEIEQAVSKILATQDGSGNQSYYQSGITKFNPAPADKSDDQPRYKHEYCFMK